MKKCAFCGCEFEADSDFTLHMDTFGWDETAHRTKFRSVHRMLDSSYYEHKTPPEPLKTYQARFSW